MTKNDIIKENEKKELKRPITGIIQEDRIWEQWYDQKKMQEDLPKMNQADYVFKCNRDYPNQTIINNRGLKKLTNQEFTNLRNKFISSLTALGIKRGDVIATVALSTPELLALKYAAAYLGAITANLNFNDASNQKMYEQLKMINPTMIFFLDIFENQVYEVLNNSEFKDSLKVRLPLSVSTPIFNTERFKINLLETSNKMQKKVVKDALTYKQFREYSLYGHLPDSVYSEKLPSNIALTSGTTGKSKAIILSHDANNALAKQHEIADLGLQRGETNLALVPPFLAFWDADIIHMAMCLGIENILELKLTYDNIPEYLKKHLPNYGIWSQYLWDSILHLPKEDLKKISSHLKKVVVGGERADVNQAHRFQEITGIRQEAGYGASEMDSCFSVANPRCNLIGSAGLPLPFNNVMVKDENGNDLTYNQPGHLYITGPAMMNGYLNNKELTNQVLIRDSKGTLWYDTKDYGYVDKTGTLFVLDRYQEPVNINSLSIQLIDIAEKVKQCEVVKLCKVNYTNGKMIFQVSFDEFSKKTKEECEQELVDYINNNFKDFEKPDILSIQDSLPRTPVGKVDYQKLNENAKLFSKEAIDGEKIKVLRK